jgi:hypothetical protein
MIIGERRALELRFDSRHRQLDAESWFATLSLQEFDENDNEVDEGSVLASAILVRVNLQHEDWFDSLDAESGDLAQVGEALSDRSLIADVDEDSLFADSLIIVDFVSVMEEHRGARLSHALVRGIAHIFRSDIVALVPASMSTDHAGKLFVDGPKRRGLRRHWKRGGFVGVPGTEVMILPLGER